jgi:hypothetical protein
MVVVPVPFFVEATAKVSTTISPLITAMQTAKHQHS